MLFRSLTTLALVGAAWASLPVPAAVAQSSGADAPAQAPQVRAWLLRIHEAASRQNFQGTFVVSGGGAVSSARIAHYCEGKNQFERSESLDGQARFLYRHNDVVQTVWPANRVAMIEQRSVPATFPALLQSGDDRIVDFYDVHPQGVDRVAGHEAMVLLVKPRDGYRFGYRLWADQSSGLLLRADVLGEHGDVLETSAFSDVAIGVKSQPETVLRPMKKVDGYRVLRPVLTPTRLDVEGWSVRQPAPGFRQVSCFKRPMEGTGVVDKKSADPQVLHTIYSDGLTYVSLFIEPFSPQRHTRPMLASVGATQSLMQQHGDWWITVVGDVPPATLLGFARDLERKK